MTRGPNTYHEAGQRKPSKRRSKACITCKIRRVLCTYERPSCQRCLKTGRKCDGYPATAPDGEEAAPVALLMVIDCPVPSNCDHAALTAFQFFIEVCAPSLLNYGSRYFWNELVLQACFVDESIKHLTIAASRLGSHNLTGSSQMPPDQDAVFLQHYGKALKLLSQTQQPDPAFLLMACLLLILCDEFQNNAFAALQHLMAGRKILAAYCPPLCIRRRCTTIDELGPIFAALELQTGEIYSQIRPLSKNWGFHAERSGWLEGDIQHFTQTLKTMRAWEDVDEVAQSLQLIALECTSQQLGGPPPRTRFHSVPNLTSRLNDWLDHYTYFESTVLHNPTATSKTSLYLLRTYHICIYILSRCEPFKQELAFDSYASNIEHVIVSCGFLIRTSKPRMIPILFFIATRYRNASIRRQAMCMLKQCGVDGQILARVALKVVRLEEKDVNDPIVCSDVPEESRIRLVDMLFDADLATYVVRYKRTPYGDDTVLQSMSLSAAALPWNTKPEKPVHASELLRSALRFDFMTFWHQDDPAFAIPAGFGPS